MLMIWANIKSVCSGWIRWVKDRIEFKRVKWRNLWENKLQIELKCNFAVKLRGRKRETASGTSIMQNVYSWHHRSSFAKSKKVNQNRKLYQIAILVNCSVSRARGSPHIPICVILVNSAWYYWSVITDVLHSHMSTYTQQQAYRVLHTSFVHADICERRGRLWANLVLTMC